MNHHRLLIIIAIFVTGFVFSTYMYIVYASEWHTIQYVYDGDTIQLSDNKQIRYIGIDAPEIDHKNDIAEPFGYAAADFNRYLLKNKKFKLEYDIEVLDRYGRYLAYIFLEDGTFVNKQLIKQGYAYYYFKSPNQKYAKKFIEAQHWAMVNNVGIWKNFNKQIQKIIGNQKTKRFHQINCSYARKINNNNKIIFKSKWEGYWQGFSSCRKCKP